MQPELKKRLAQLGNQSIQGLFGEQVKSNAAEYALLQNEGMNVFLKLIHDFYGKPLNTEEDRMMAEGADVFCQLIIAVYRETKKEDEDVAASFVNSFIEDFPNAPNSCLYPQWEALAKATMAFKSAPATQNPLIVWQQSLKLVQAYNEFLNVLIGYFLVAWRCALGKSYSINTFSNAYGAKINEFSQLTGGHDGAFNIIFQVANHSLRNAIAHEDIWLDSGTNTVKYTAGKRPKTTHEIGIGEFFGYAMMGANFGQAYIVAIAALIVLEDGSLEDKKRLPAHLVKVFTHV